MEGLNVPSLTLISEAGLNWPESDVESTEGFLRDVLPRGSQAVQVVPSFFLPLKQICFWKIYSLWRLQFFQIHDWHLTGT